MESVLIESSFVNKLPRALQELLTAIASGRLIIPYYHMISDEPQLHVRHIYPYKNSIQFKSDLEYLLRRYAPISLDQVIVSINQGLKFSKRSFLLTFDDGFSEMSTVVKPILETKGVPAVFFLSTKFINNNALFYQHLASLLVDKMQSGLTPGQYQAIGEILGEKNRNKEALSSAISKVLYDRGSLLTRVADIIEFDIYGFLKTRQPYLSNAEVFSLIKAGFAIGSHSVDHPKYSDISLEEQLRQTFESTSYLKQKFQIPYSAFAFPHTDWGVNKIFFDEIYCGGKIQVSFGTSGLLKDSIHMNLQRLSFENPVLPAAASLAMYSGRKLKRMFSGKGTIIR